MHYKKSFLSEEKYNLTLDEIPFVRQKYNFALQKSFCRRKNTIWRWKEQGRTSLMLVVASAEVEMPEHENVTKRKNQQMLQIQDL